MPQCMQAAVSTPRGTAMRVVSRAHASDPTIRAPMPKLGSSSVGYHSVEKKKSVRDISSNAGNACAQRKTTIAVSDTTLTPATSLRLRSK